MASSKRQKRQSIRRGAHELKNKPGWDPTNFEREDPLDRLRDLNQQERPEASFAAASQCPDCQSEAAKTGRADALCPTHLAEVMGF